MAGIARQFESAAFAAPGVYRVDNEIRGTVMANKSTHHQDLTGQEREFAIRCAC